MRGLRPGSCPAHWVAFRKTVTIELIGFPCDWLYFSPGVLFLYPQIRSEVNKEGPSGLAEESIVQVPEETGRKGRESGLLLMG